MLLYSFFQCYIYIICLSWSCVSLHKCFLSSYIVCSSWENEQWLIFVGQMEQSVFEFFYMLFYLFNALLKFFLRCLCSGYWMLFKLWRFMMQNLCIWRFTTYVYSRIVLYFCVKALCFYLTMYLAKSLISWNNWSSMAATMNGCGMGGMFMLISIISSH